ncbi:MAG: nucleotide exchange factor GrpE [Tepidiformaceae bacterium]
MTANEDRILDKRAASRMTDEGGPPVDHAREAGGEAQPAPAAEQAAAGGASELAEALARAETNYKNWQRSAADFINYKRRVEMERGETARLAQAALVINLLPIFDDLDRAVATVDANLAGLNWVQGIVAIQRKFAQLMEAMQVREIAAAGEPFDPALHEAVGRQPGEDNKVLHVVQKGYQLGERVVRPAMVIVGAGE